MLEFHLETGQIVWRFPPTLCISRVWILCLGIPQDSAGEPCCDWIPSCKNKLSNITLTAWLLLFNALNFHNSLVPGSKSDQQITQDRVNGWSLQKLILALERNGDRPRCPEPSLCDCCLSSASLVWRLIQLIMTVQLCWIQVILIPRLCAWTWLIFDLGRLVKDEKCVTNSTLYMILNK